MTCEECKERVFDLIEQEAADPEGVHEILFQCPECRALFDDMKTALALAEQLPRDEPSLEIDATVLRAAKARASRATPQRRWFAGSTWALAAIALLAVSIGVWAIPRTGPAPGGAPTARPGGDATSGAVVQVEAEIDRPGPTAALETLGAEETAAVRPRRPRAGQRARKASAAREPDPSRATARGDSSGADVAFAEAGDDAKAERQSHALSPACRALRERVDQAMARDDDASPGSVEPEDELSLGRCYREAGDVFEARRWLERAASHPETKRRALRELRTMSVE